MKLFKKVVAPMMTRYETELGDTGFWVCFSKGEIYLTFFNQMKDKVRQKGFTIGGYSV